MLLRSVQSSFQVAITEMESLISRYESEKNPPFDPATIPARLQFLARRIKLLQNLLQWRECAGEKYGVGALSTRLVENSIFPVAQSGWEVGGEESIRKVRNADDFRCWR
jgi:GC-rich sequence DNA-binding factor